MIATRASSHMSSPGNNGHATSHPNAIVNGSPTASGRNGRNRSRRSSRPRIADASVNSTTAGAPSPATNTVGPDTTVVDSRRDSTP
jgi:hypothetical protein